MSPIVIGILIGVQVRLWLRIQKLEGKHETVAAAWRSEIPAMRRRVWRLMNETGLFRKGQAITRG